jgi:putative SOS response-associated peptidase YedK
MCGRFTQALEHEALQLRFGFEPYEFTYRPRYNIAPMQDVAVIATEGDSRVLRQMRWGLVPSWSKQEKYGYKMINARAETVAEKPSFKRSLMSKRCLVPASGYFEWRELPESRPTKKVKVPMYFSLRGGEPFAFAGLWDVWRRFDDKVIVSFTIITCAANEMAAPIHDRMPVMLHPEDEVRWLDPTIQDASLLTPLLRPYPSEEMDVHEVSKLVNSPRNDSPDCIRPVA